MNVKPLPHSSPSVIATICIIISTSVLQSQDVRDWSTQTALIIIPGFGSVINIFFFFPLHAVSPEERGGLFLF